MKLSICTPVFDTKIITEKCVQAVLGNTTVDYEYLLVHNHPPYSDVLPYLKEVERDYPCVKILDPGKNLGCHRGLNLAFDNAQGDFLMKLDCDTILPNDKEWAQKMIKAFDLVPDLMMLTADLNGGKQVNVYETKDYGEGIILETTDAFIDIPATMLKKESLEILGKFEHEGLYGGEGLFYNKKIKELKKIIAHFPPVKCRHLGRGPGTDIIYAFWKYQYGFLAKTTKNFVDWALEVPLNLGFREDCERFDGFNSKITEDIFERLRKIQETKSFDL